jgi:hypothetical protein
MNKLWGLLLTILAAAASIFGYKYQKAKADHAEDRAESAEEGLQNATDAKTIDHTVRTSTSAERDRLRNKWTRD